MNNNTIRMMIRCIVNTGEKNSTELQNMISKKIKNRWSSVHVVLRREEKYWKYDDSTDIVYGIAHEKLISVKDVISLFDVSWNYSLNNPFNVDTQQSEEVEEALWSKNVHPEEKFLLNWVTWVHVYTWKE